MQKIGMSDEASPKIKPYMYSKLYKIRTQKNISIKDLSAVSKLSRQSIIEWEKRGYSRHIVIFIKFLNFYNIDFNDILKDSKGEELKLGKMLTHDRNVLNLSREKVSRGLDVSLQTVTAWENEQIPPQVYKFISIIKYLDCKLEDLI